MPAIDAAQNSGNWAQAKSLADAGKAICDTNAAGWDLSAGLICGWIDDAYERAYEIENEGGCGDGGVPGGEEDPEEEE